MTENRYTAEIDKLFKDLAHHNIRYSVTPHFKDDEYFVLCYDRNDKRLMGIIFSNPKSYYESDEIFKAFPINEDDRMQKGIACQTAQEIIDMILPELRNRRRNGFKKYGSPDRAEALQDLWEKLESEKIPTIMRQLNGGGQIMILDKNPYDANVKSIMSIVLHNYSYGHKANLFETAYLKTDGSGDAYEIEGWQTADEVMERVRKIRKGVQPLWKA